MACDASESEAFHDQRAALGSSAPGVWLAVTEDEGELVRTFHGEDAPATTEVRAVPMAPDEQLSATQAQWCNTPAPGEEIVCDVPVPDGKDETKTLLDLWADDTSSSGPPVRIPITVKHGI